MSKNNENKKELLELGTDELENVSGGALPRVPVGGGFKGSMTSVPQTCARHENGENNYTGSPTGMACATCKYFTVASGRYYCGNTLT